MSVGCYSDVQELVCLHLKMAPFPYLFFYLFVRNSGSKKANNLMIVVYCWQAI